MLIILLFSVAFIFTPFGILSAHISPGNPIVLIPGDGGTQIEAKLNKTKVVHYFCDKTTKDFFTLWLNLELLVPVFALDCFVDNMRLVFDNTTKKTTDSPGVKTQINDWGNTSTVEWLDPSKSSLGIYFASIVQKAVKWGYKRGKSIRGAPFDFRKAPNEMGKFFTKLKALIEETYYINGNSKVITIGHSMGNPVILYFFNHVVSSQWKSKFIQSHISISAPWGGSVKIMKLFASGYNLDHYRIFLPPSKLRPMQRSFMSSAFLMPSDKFWPSNETLVVTEKRNYSTGNFEQFFKDIKYETGWEMYKTVGKMTYDMTPPEVEIHCLYGTKLPTPIRLEYGKGYFPDYQPVSITGDGDGTVPIRSLKGCMHWSGAQKQKVFSKEYPNREHLDILDSDVIDYIKSVALANPNSTKSKKKKQIV